jgi:hypothetical protein
MLWVAAIGGYCLDWNSGKDRLISRQGFAQLHVAGGRGWMRGVVARSQPHYSVYSGHAFDYAPHTEDYGLARSYWHMWQEFCYFQIFR